MPSSLPIMISFGVTEESRTSAIRFDFSSMVLLSSICMTVKIEIQSRYTNPTGTLRAMRSAVLTVSVPAALPGSNLPRRAHVASISRTEAASTPRAT